MSRDRLVDLAGALFLASLTFGTWLPFGDFAMDDFFITYRYAENLVSGEGFVFNPGERVFGTTAPGLALLLAGLRAVTGAPVPWLGGLVTAVSLLVVTVTVFLEARRRGRGAEALLGGALTGTSTFVWIHNGSEIYLVLALLVVGSVLAPRLPSAAGAVAGFAVWGRPDAVLGAGLLGLLEWVRRRRLPWAFAIAAGMTLAVGLIAADAWFGSFLPGTLEAKRLQAEWRPDIWPSGIHFWPTAVFWLVLFAAGGAVVPLGVLGLAGLPVVLRRGGPSARLLALYALALGVAYPLLGVALYPWYVLPMLVALFYGVAFAGGAAGRAAWRFFGRGRAAAVVSVTIAALVVAPVTLEVALRNWRLPGPRAIDARPEDYELVGRWLRGHTAPDQVVAALEVGTLGFYAERPIHDVLGLVSPSAIPHIARGDLLGAFRSGDPDLFAVNDPERANLEVIFDSPGFVRGWCEVARFRTPVELVVYGRRPAGDRPPAGRPDCAASVDEALRRGAAPAE